MSEMWKKYLLNHKDKTEYDESVEQIQLNVDLKANIATNFVHLSDHPTLVVLTKSLGVKEFQPNFYHWCAKKPSLLALALAGFGSLACAMKVEAKDMFSLPPKKKFPSIKQFMNWHSLDDILNLKPDQTYAEEDKIVAFSIIPLFLLEIPFSDDSIKAQDNHPLRARLRTWAVL